MLAASSSETSLNFYQTCRRENLKSHLAYECQAWFADEKPENAVVLLDSVQSCVQFVVLFMQCLCLAVPALCVLFVLYTFYCLYRLFELLSEDKTPITPA
jgi:hypothetical protein